MHLFPAIDLKDNQVVRLTRGDYDQVKVYSDDPLATAKQWLNLGAQWLHIVDLDAALEGKPVHLPLIQQIAQEVQRWGKKIQIGGGHPHFENP